MSDDLEFSDDALEALLRKPSESGYTVRNKLFEDFMPALEDTHRSDQVTTVIPKVEVDDNIHDFQPMFYQDDAWLHYEKPKRNVSWLFWLMLFAIAAIVGITIGIAAGGQLPSWDEFLETVEGLDSVFQA